MPSNTVDHRAMRVAVPGRPIDRIALCACIVVLVAAGCGRTEKASDTGRGSQASTAAPPVASAESREAAALPVVDNCPRSLGGEETVARTIKKECGPITITRNYDVEGSLTLEAGAVLKFQDGAALEVGQTHPAALIVNGTEKEPVTMTSADAAAAPGAWGGVRLIKANHSRIHSLVIEYAGGVFRGEALLVAASDVTLTGSTIRNAKEIGLEVQGAGRFAEMSGNTFEKAGKVAISASAPAVAGLGPNKFDNGAFVQVSGDLEEDTTWQNPGAPYVLDYLEINGLHGRATLEILAGTELRMRIGITVGRHRDAALVVSGTPDKPVVFTTADDKRLGRWRSISVLSHGEARIANAIIAYGGADGSAALFLAGGTTTVSGTTFEGNERSVKVSGATLKSFDHNKLSASPEPALTIDVQQVGSLGTANTFDKDARIEIPGGGLDRSATWNPQAVPYEITADIGVDRNATLTLLPGIDLAFRRSVGLDVGFRGGATIKAIGTPDRPIKLRALRETAPWKGVSLSSNTVNAELANVQLSDTSAAAGITVADGAVARISDVSCARCAHAVLTAGCHATLTASGIKAEAGTPAEELKPLCPR